MTSNEHNPIALDGLLAALQARGFVLGVDQHLRLQLLLARIGAEPCSLEQVKTWLCPLIATNRDQQREFYRLFEEFVAVPEPAAEPAPAPAPPARRSWRRLRLTIYSIAIALLLAGTALVATQRFRLLVGLDQLQLPEIPEWIPPRPIQTIVETITLGEIRPREIERRVAVPPPDWALEHRWTLRLLAIALPLLVFALWLFWRWWRRRPAIEKAQGRRPPFTWPIELEPEEWRLDRSPLYRQAARGLRRRQRDDFEHLDIPRTIEATIEARGYLRFRYRRASRVPEYLLLIDRASRHDHQARYFELLADALERDGLFVVRYFYDGDPRVCHAGKKEERDRYLSELQRRYPAHRLILMGSAAKLFDPVSGEYARWTELLTEWEDRAVLTPVAPGAWHRRERLLREGFTLQPGTLAGLAELAERYDLPLREEPPAGEADPPPNVRYGVTIDELRRYLGPDAFQWLCACAVYPELQWDLTQHLGRLALPAADGLDEAALWRLLRLPWFREGVIPDEARVELVRALDPARARAIREFLIETLEKNPAEPGTFAADERRLDIAVQKAWLAGDDRAARQKALEEIEDLPPGELARDYTLIRLLEEKPTTLLALLLPRSFRRFVYPEGLSIYSVRWQAAVLFAVMAALLLLGGLDAYLRYREAHRAAPPVENPTLPPTPDLSPIPPQPSPTVTVTPLSGGTPSPAQTAMVTLNLTSEPGARVYVRNEERAVIPPGGNVKIPLPPGRQSILVLKEGYQEGRKELALSLANNPANERVDLVPIPNSAEGDWQPSLGPRTWFPAPFGWRFYASGALIRGDKLILYDTESSRDFNTYRDFKLEFNVVFTNGKGIAWAARAKDPNNYYLFEISRPQSRPQFNFYVCRNGILILMGNIPIIENMEKKDDSFHIIFEARGNRFDTRMTTASAPSAQPHLIGIFQDDSISYGGVGFRAKDLSESLLQTFFVIPLQ